MSGPRYEDVRVGDELPEQRFRLIRDTLRRYADASGDFNPIHLDQEFALSVGLPDVIAHGMLTMAEAGRVLTDWSGDPAAVVEYGVRFSKPVVVPDDGGAEVAVRGQVVDKLDGRRVAVELAVTSGGEKVLTKARAVIELR